VCLEISGPAVTDVHHNFVQRWNEASDRNEPDGRWGPDAGRDLAFPDQLAPACGSTVAQVQRTIHPGRYTSTCATPGGTPFVIADGEFSNHDQYIHAIRAAREYIYLENQAVSVRPILEELVAAVTRGVVVVLLLPTEASNIEAPGDRDDDLFRDERRTLARAPNFTLAGLAGQDAGGARQPVHVHAKLMIIDDVWATVGSCNLHRYSMCGNSELNIAFADPVAVRTLRCGSWRSISDRTHPCSMAGRRSACFGRWLSGMRVAGMLEIPTGKESRGRWIHFTGGQAEPRRRAPGSQAFGALAWVLLRLPGLVGIDRIQLPENLRRRIDGDPACAAAGVSPVPSVIGSVTVVPSTRTSSGMGNGRLPGTSQRTLSIPFSRVLTTRGSAPGRNRRRRTTCSLCR
jgi:hypothetical protein